jgi:hypothetical protein
VSSDRVTSKRQDNPSSRDDESAIIDVPEEPLLPPRQPPTPEHFRGQYETPQEAPYVVSQEPPVEPQPRFEPRYQPPPPPEPPPQPAPQPQAEPQPRMQDWQPVVADGQWLPPGAPGSHWTGVDSPSTPAREQSGPRRRARHYGPDEPLDGSFVESEPLQPYTESGHRARSRHSAEYRDYGVQNFAATDEPPAATPPPPPAAPVPAAPPPPQMAPPPPPKPAPRHRGADPLSDGLNGSAEGPQSGGHSVADLFARLQVEPSAGGRRRHREG